MLAVFGAASLLALRSLANAEALRDARQFATLAGQGIVEPTIAPGLLRGEPQAIAAVDRIVQERVLGERVVRVKLWTRDGRIVYSDEPRLIGARFPLDAEKLDVLRTGTTKASLSDLAGPENRYERGQGDLYEVYLPIRAPDGTPLLFETYQRRSAVASTGRRIWMPFAGAPPRQASSSSGSSRCPSHRASTAGSAAPRRSARRCSSVRSRHPPTSDGGSRPSSTTGPSRILRGSRTH